MRTTLQQSEESNDYLQSEFLQLSCVHVQMGKEQRSFEDAHLLPTVTLQCFQGDQKGRGAQGRRKKEDRGEERLNEKNSTFLILQAFPFQEIPFSSYLSSLSTSYPQHIPSEAFLLSHVKLHLPALSSSVDIPLLHILLLSLLEYSQLLFCSYDETVCLKGT